MSKFGVGVGDEFPVDDGAAKAAAGAGDPPNTPQDDRAEFEDWKRRRDAYRAQRDVWRAQRDEWRSRRREWKERWRAERRAFRDDLRFGGAAHVGPCPAYASGGTPWRLLVAIAAIALVVVALSHIGYVLVGLAVLAILYAAYHHHHEHYDPFDIGPRDVARPAPDRTPQSPAAS